MQTFEVSKFVIEVASIAFVFLSTVIGFVVWVKTEMTKIGQKYIELENRINKQELDLLEAKRDFARAIDNIATSSDTKFEALIKDNKDDHLRIYDKLENIVKLHHDSINEIKTIIIKGNK